MMRQWAYFPRATTGSVLVASPQVFRLLAESRGGRLVIATVLLREDPESNLASDLACLVDEPQFALVSPERIAGEFDARHAVSLDLCDVDLETDNPLELTAAIPRAVAQLAVHASKGGIGTLSLPVLRTATAERLTTEWRTTRAEFISRLDPDVVAQARAIDGLRPSTYNYLTTVSATIRRNRAQAMAVFPLLRPVLMTSAFDAVRKDIDAGRPLIDVLALHYRASKAMIRALRGVAQDDLDKQTGQMDVLVKLLNEIPASWWPRDPATWRKFSTAASTISRISRHPITTSTNQLWLARAAQGGYETDDKTPEDLALLGRDIDEFIDTLRRALNWALPYPQNPDSRIDVKGPIEIAAMLKAEMGLAKLSQLVRRFGDAYRQAVTEFAEQAEIWRGVRWPALGEGVYEYGEILIQPLLTPADLKNEGEEMCNCVAAYVEPCMKGVSQIWSVQLCTTTKKVSRLSTLETRVRKLPNGRTTLGIEQHKGIRNIAPSETAWRAARAHAAYFSENPRQMQAYLDWKQTISRKPLDVRQRHALMLPIVTALEKTLPGKWAWQRLIELTTARQNGADRI